MRSLIAYEQGTVSDPVVVANCAWVKRSNPHGECRDSPSDVFDKAARETARKYKYKPAFTDGVLVETKGVQNKITWELEN